MNVACPKCDTIFRVDPSKVPDRGIRARCSVCSAVFRVELSPVVVPPLVAPVVLPAQVVGPVAEAPRPAPRPPQESARPTGSVSAPVPGPAAPAIAAPQRPTPMPPSPPREGAGRPPAPFSAPAVPPAARVVSSPAPAPRVISTPASSAPPAQPATAPPPTPPAPSAAPTPAAPSVHAMPVASTTPRLAPAGPAGSGRPKRINNPFLSQDPAVKARRLARALVSDIVVYHPAKRQDGLRDGSLKVLFEEEIRKSWEEYTEQIGLDYAQSTPFFTEALNEILAEGHPVFS